MIVVGGTGALACHKFFDGDDRRVPFTIATGVVLAVVSYSVVRGPRPISAVRSWLARTRS